MKTKREGKCSVCRGRVYRYPYELRGRVYCSWDCRRTYRTAETLARRHQVPQQPIEYKLIPLTKGKFAKVSNADYDHLSTMAWHLKNSRYAENDVANIRMHTYIFCELMGNPRPAPGVTVIDHMNRDTFDNRRENLRLVSYSQNGINRKTTTHLSSIHRGVNAERRLWASHITIDQKTFFIGRYDDELEAAWMYDQWAIELHGDFACLNFSYQHL